MSNSLAPIEPPFSAEVAELLAQYPQQNGYILSLFRTFANSTRFLKKGVPNLLDRASPLDLRTREIVILRVTAKRNCEYEWGVHVAIFAGAAKLSEAQIAATRNGDRDCWTQAELRLIDLIDEICETATLHEDSLKDFQTAWAQEQQLEILALIGAYSTISYVANIARLPGEAFGAHFPA